MKIHIFGASGSGVTTLGLALAEKLEIPYFDSDLYFWEPTEPPFTIRREPQLRNQQITDDIKKHADWILGGSVINWGDDWMPAFDLVVFLLIPNTIRIERLKKRELERYGNIIFTDPDRHRQYNEFIEWAAGYDDNTARGRTLQAHEQWIQRLTCPVLEIREDNSVEDCIQLIMERL